VGPQLPVLLASVIMGAAVLLLQSQLRDQLPALWLLPVLVAAGGAVYATAISLAVPGLFAQSVKRVTAWF
jgi:hypothetical protein